MIIPKTYQNFKLIFILTLLITNNFFANPTSKLSEKEKMLFEKYAKQLKKGHDLSSMSAKEKDYRFHIFESHLKLISHAEVLTEENLKEEDSTNSTFTTGINKFSFLSDEEFERRFLISEPIMNADSEAQKLFNNPEYSFDYFLKTVLKEIEETVDSANDTLKLAEQLGFNHGFGKNFSMKNVKKDISGFMGQGLSLGESKETTKKEGWGLDSSDFLKDDDMKMDMTDFHFRILGNKNYLKLKGLKDWRPQFNPVFDQGDCNACYITSSLDTIEAIHNKIHPNQRKIKLSIQEIIDCSSENSGCLGGQPSAVFNYIKKNGIAFADSYRYNQRKGACKIKIGSQRNNRILQTNIGSQRNNRILQSNFYDSGNGVGSGVDLLNQSYLDLINDIYKISNTPMMDLMKNVTPEEVEKNNMIIKQVNIELLKMRLPYRKTLQYDYIREKFFFVVNHGNSPSDDQYLDLYGFPYIPGIILLNDIQKSKDQENSQTQNSKPSQNQSNSSKFPLPSPEQKKPSQDNELVSFASLPPKQTPKFTSPPRPNRYEDLKNFYFIRPNVIELLRALQYGPVIIAHYVPSVFKFYKRGVFDGQGCENVKLEMVNHAAIVVGYNLRAKPPYFRLRSSWGSDWGENGHYRMTVGALNKANKGTCLLAGTPFMVFPHIKNFA